MIIKNKFNSTKIIFGNNKRAILSKLIKKKNLLIVCSKRGRNKIIFDKKLSFINNNNIFWIDDVTSNPSLKYLQNKTKVLKCKKFDYIIAIGGGSVIDSAKVFLSFVCLKKKQTVKKLIHTIAKIRIKKLCNLVAIPTTSGTGSEVTPYATVWDEKNKKKLSLNHKILFPNIAIIDPVLTYDLPEEITIFTALDALNQAFESIWNKNATEKTIICATKSIKLSYNSLANLNKNINLKKVRTNLAKASVLAGLCISQTRTSICHSISYPLSLHFGIPHGLACAFSMIAIINYINKQNKFFFNDLFNISSIKNGKNLENKLKKIFLHLKIKKKIKSYLKNKKKLFSLIDEMQTPGRSDNFIYKINNKFLKSILEKSYY